MSKFFTKLQPVTEEIFFVQGKEIFGYSAAYITYIIIHFVVVNILPLIVMVKELIHLAGLLQFLAGTTVKETSSYSVIGMGSTIAVFRAS